MTKGTVTCLRCDSPTNLVCASCSWYMRNVESIDPPTCVCRRVLCDDCCPGNLELKKEVA